MRLIPMHREHLRASVGDRLVVDGRSPDVPPREGEILEVHGENGSPPYIVLCPDGQERAVYPGPNARVVARTDSV